MASVAGRVKPGDVLCCEVNGDRFFATAEDAPEKVSPRVFEIPVKVIGAGVWQKGKRYTRVRGRQVIAIYRRLK